MYWLGTLVLKRKNEKLQVAENSWVRRMGRVKREHRQDIKVKRK